ncbi:hypothetical protein DEU56DRAFT_817738 [Suillus clintonianus]|uniref:uncharacterized protein n=1 Tax=Suillus clintonianus TaxID=1904413 RepID=UPI001B86C698|nr:uncharacterized protein DEU56DRAFT_817738 [Suillus clintonianus]KAG2129121.1 hypothetical protein DEU56DRAFT_817738 [Suillus clintonianus]
MQASALLSHIRGWLEDVFLFILSVAVTSTVAFNAMKGLITKSHTLHKVLGSCAISTLFYDWLALRQVRDNAIIQLLRRSTQLKRMYLGKDRLSKVHCEHDLSCPPSRDDHLCSTEIMFFRPHLDLCMQPGYRNHRSTSLPSG